MHRRGVRPDERGEGCAEVGQRLADTRVLLGLDRAGQEVRFGIWTRIEVVGVDRLVRASSRRPWSSRLSVISRTPPVRASSSSDSTASRVASYSCRGRTSLPSGRRPRGCTSALPAGQRVSSSTTPSRATSPGFRRRRSRRSPAPSRPHRWRRRRGCVARALRVRRVGAPSTRRSYRAPVLGLLVVHFVHLADILLVTRLHVLAERRPELLVLPRGLAGVVLDPVKHPPVLLFTFERGERRHERSTRASRFCTARTTTPNSCSARSARNDSMISTRSCCHE